MTGILFQYITSIYNKIEGRPYNSISKITDTLNWIAGKVSWLLPGRGFPVRVTGQVFDR